MRKIILILIVLACAAHASAQATYATTQAKADRFFSYKEWASAAALYNLMLHERPAVPDTYGRAIVAYEMLGDSIRSLDLLDQAMSHGVALDSVLANVQKYTFSIGKGHLYEQFMLSAARKNQWMERPLDAYLLRYYAFRRNGPQMVAYARKMLAGTPGSVPFMLILAEGLMISNDDALALETWKKVLAIDPANYIAILNIANYYDLAGDARSALDYFIKARDIRPTPYVDNAIREIKQPLKLNP